MKIKKFEATWCSACKKVDELIKDLDVIKIDADKNPTAIKEFDIKKLPTIIVENENGEEVFRHVGASLDRAELDKWLKG